VLLGLRRAVSFVNARVAVGDAVAGSLRFDTHISSINEPPRRGDLVVDLEGAFVLPGLVNAHDHLELNHYGPLKRRHRYENASAWIEDLRPVLRQDSKVRKNASYPLRARLFIGALKNVLAGVTTVAHHNPRYREIDQGCPVRVVGRYGWAHSFSLERHPVGARGEPGGDVRARCLETPDDVPFIVHLAEGVDDRARAELPRLEALGCLRPTTVLVHGVALTAEDWSRIVARGAGLVWCPVSNAFLFGRTAPVRTFLDRFPGAWAHLALGSDSRVTGSRDLLDELRAAAALMPVTGPELLRMVTTAPARMLRMGDAGRIAVGVPADLIVLPPIRRDFASALLAASRRDLSLVTLGGQPMVGAPAFEALFGARGTRGRPIVVDGVERLAATRLARAIARCPITEPGVESGA
jgi:cytosine/adenosine deaminase-related metal-dependent hydrolase